MNDLYGAQGFLVAYSEWLDAQGLMADEIASGDKRSHEELARDFIAERVAARADTSDEALRKGHLLPRSDP